MYPEAGGQYVYLKEAFGKFYGFLYGWSFFAVIQTGTIAAVGVAFGKFAGYLYPALGDDNLLLGTADHFHISAAQIVGIVTIVLLTFINTGGVKSGKWIQFIFTFAKIAAMAVLIIFGLIAFNKGGVWDANWTGAWVPQSIKSQNGDIIVELLSNKALIAALCASMVGALFSSDAWNSVTFIAGELKRPERNIGLSLFIGTLVVTLLYLFMNFMYLNVMSVSEIATAPANRVATAAALKIFGGSGAIIIAVLIMVSTFGCNNGLILSGARVYYTMAADNLFLKQAGKLNSKGVPSSALWMQCGWASLLCLSGQYGNLLDYIVFTVLIFYILTIGGIFKLRKDKPLIPRPYKAFGYPFIPILYIILAAFICIVLLITQPIYSGLGLLIVLTGIPLYYLSSEKSK